MGILNDFSKRKAQQISMLPQDVRNVGDVVLFEYRCVEEHGSCDSELWYRSHQTVTIMSKPRGSDGSDVMSVGSYAAGTTRDERLEMGEPLVYRVKFKDGFVGDVSEDELLDSPAEFERHDPPKRKKASIKGRVVGGTYQYDDLTEQEKNDAWLTVDDGVDPRNVSYVFSMKTPDQIKEMYGYDLDEWLEDDRMLALMESIKQNGVRNAAVDREGNHRLIACALLGVDCPWFEVVDSGISQDQKRRAQSDMENYAEFIEMVPISTLKKLRHVDRSVEENRDLTPEEWEELKQSIIQNGWTSPLIVTYFEADNTAVLGEGNHRLAIADELGMTEVPVRVYRHSYAGHEGPYANHVKPVRGHPDAPGYVPADLRPSDIGLI